MTAVPTKPVAAPPRPKALAAVTRGKLAVPYRVVLYGVEGVGKSTFAAGAPSPIFVGADAGTAHLTVTRMPEPRTWLDVRAYVQELTTDAHEYKTLVLDPVNWIEALLFDHLKEANGWKSIEDPGFGKGYTAALDHWRALISDLERLWSARSMNIIMLAHPTVKSFSDPAGPSYDRYEIAMHKGGAGLIKQWCDAVLFAIHESTVKTDERTKRLRGVATGARVVHTQWAGAWDAKNRLGLPEELPLSWRAFVEAAEATREQLAAVRAQIKALVEQIGDPEVAAKAVGYVADAKDDVGQLAEIANALGKKLEGKEASK